MEVKCKLEMEEGYEDSPALGSGISLDSRKEKLCLVRMPHDFDPEMLEKAQLAAILIKGGEIDTPSRGGKKQKQRSSSFVEDHGLGDGYRLSVDTKSNEVSTFRAVVSGIVEGQSNIGPAFDTVVSISKKIVPLDKSMGAVKLNLKQLPKNMVMSIPASYVKKDQVPGLKQIYKKETANKKVVTDSSSGKKRKTSAAASSAEKVEKKAKKSKKDKK